ncbi:MAG: Gll3051 protein [uncultured Craurococcus sp.]|uniref:Gll3051 protein n=1 Tax=uncultured Craurococcus sp. TaxID=1135998 RepID=A0A6J4IG56_9PROT|nr:MAG: Gll3051 protein [uncultured Craurococcus sp.]
MFQAPSPAAPYGVTRPPIHTAIAVPARNEEARLPSCLEALSRQHGLDRHRGGLAGVAVFVLANNCTDGTAALARRLAPRFPFQLVVEEAELSAPLAHAGGARRMAMDGAAALFGPDVDPRRAALLSTDADGRADPRWLAANLRALALGADGVAGAIRPDPLEAARLPAALRDQEAKEARYLSLLDEIATLIDPDADDPWPRHAVHSGASIALSLDAYRRIGGLPPLPVGEDRALFEALLRAGLRVRHCPAALITVSCRLEGRAAGGMADSLRRRMTDPDAAPVDDRLEPALDALLRLRCRRALRRLRAGLPRLGDPHRLAIALGIPVAMLVAIARRPSFWESWELLQAAAWPLRRQRRLQASELQAELDRATAMLPALRGARAILAPHRLPSQRATSRGGTARFATASPALQRARQLP